MTGPEAVSLIALFCGIGVGWALRSAFDAALVRISMKLLSHHFGKRVVLEVLTSSIAKLDAKDPPQ